MKETDFHASSKSSTIMEKKSQASIPKQKACFNCRGAGQCKNAFIAVEDKRFYEHHGIDLNRLAVRSIKIY
ncbi:transglycosylase domain-containing protein [Bacillus licheniformis]|nr:transglycosylase domain-containing protein [Bacillus licheniformis]